ncbi:MAG TPA: glucokinase [Polyangiales bacterium]|nr:glucokinase [Polyangiales bacterium]
MLLLAGDIGGTKTLLGLYDYDPDARPATPPRELERARFGSKEHPSLEAVLELFLHGRSVAVAVFAMAGPIVAGRWKGTNFAWELDVSTLSAQLSAPVALLNDLEAAVYGLAELREDELRVLAPGQRDPTGPIAMIAAGTGLGEAIAIPLPDGRLRVLASEGGHTDFAARNALEIALLQFLSARHKKRVSVERAVSGPGLVALHDFVLAEDLVPSDPATAEQMRSGDPGEVIARRGERGEDAACERALDLFVALYGAEAGNLALKVLPTGGLYVAGATAQKLAARLERGDFMAAFLDKGRMAPLLARLPVLLVLQPDLGLLGARAHAAGICRTNLAQ